MIYVHEVADSYYLPAANLVYENQQLATTSQLHTLAASSIVNLYRTGNLQLSWQLQLPIKFLVKFHISVDFTTGNCPLPSQSD